MHLPKRSSDHIFRTRILVPVKSSCINRRMGLCCLKQTRPGTSFWYHTINKQWIGRGLLAFVNVAFELIVNLNNIDRLQLTAITLTFAESDSKWPLGGAWEGIYVQLSILAYIVEDLHIPWVGRNNSYALCAKTHGAGSVGRLFESTRWITKWFVPGSFVYLRLKT